MLTLTPASNFPQNGRVYEKSNTYLVLRGEDGCVSHHDIKAIPGAWGG
jgi:hypothetical protein